MNNKIALIFGVTGQDGAYLSKFLLKKNYIFRCQRRNSTTNTYRRTTYIVNHFQKNKILFTLW